MGLLLIGEGGWITGTHMWHLCRFVTNGGGGDGLYEHICCIYVGLLLIGEGGGL